jgi:TolB protein
MIREIQFPDIAFDPLPSDGAENQPRDLTLSWSSARIENDSLLYDVFLFKSNMNQPLESLIDHPDTFLIIENLDYATTYFWQVNIKSSTGGATQGDIWNFTTLPFPDNRYAFVTRKENNYQIYSSNEEDETRVQLTSSTHNNLFPLFSTNRNKIAFVANPDLDYHIFVMNPDGTDIQQITQIPVAGFHSNGSGYCWRVNCIGFLYSHYEKLYRINLDGGGLKAIATAPEGRHFGTCDYSEKINKIVVQTIGSLIYEGEICLVNPNGSEMDTLVQDLPGIIQSPTFSIDGKYVMFTRDVSGFDSPEGRMLDSRIFLINLETREITDISEGKTDGTNDLYPRFSPFGSEVIFTNGLNDNSGQKAVMTMGTDGGNRAVIFENAEMAHWQ